MDNIREKIQQHQQQIQQCTRCPQMIGPPIIGEANVTKIISVGQAPGEREGNLGRPFAWTAGKTLFKWFASIGVDEETYRQNVYMVAVCRCFPGKNPKRGDRVPNREEIVTCSDWLKKEFALQQPELILPIGKLAIQQFLSFDKLTEVVGQSFQKTVYGQEVTIIPLPHPSGASTWHNMPIGKALLKEALALIKEHPQWRELR